MWHWFAHCSASADTWRRAQQSNNGDVIVLGLILLVIVAVFGVAVVVSNPGVHELSLFRVLVPVTYGGIFFSGVGATVVAVLGVILIRVGLRRARARRRERKELVAGPVPGGSASSTAKADAKADQSRPAEPKAAEAAGAGSAAPTARASSLDLDAQSSTTEAERRAMLDETEELTRDDPTK
jgi:hypothetical protein